MRKVITQTRVKDSVSRDKLVLKAQILLALKQPALWLTLALIFNVFEGAFRKWVPGFDQGSGRALMYFSKDIFLALGVARLFSHSKVRIRQFYWIREKGQIVFFLIVIGSMVSLVQGYNLVGTTLSLRAVILLPLLAYAYVSRVKAFPLLGFALIAVLLTAINALLALLQTRLPASHLLNQYASDKISVIEVSYGVRATGTFAYITGLGLLSAVGVWAGMVLVSLGQSWKWQVAGALGIISGFACSFATVSRGTLVTAVAMVAIWALTSIRATRVMFRVFLYGMILALILLVVSPDISEQFFHMGEGTIDRFESAGDDNTHRAFGQFSEMWHAITEHPIGRGLGTEQVGGNYVATGSAGFTLYESQFPRIVAEFGVIGFLGYLGMVAVVIFSLQRLRGGRGYQRFNLAITATQVFLLGQFYSNVVYNHTASAFVWLIIAAVMAASPIPTRKRRCKKQKQSPRAVKEKMVNFKI